MMTSENTLIILFLCTGNSYRSQMAEALVNTRLGDHWQAYCTGTKPAGYVHPKALQVLVEIIIHHLGLSKNTDQVREITFDLVITVCTAAAESCPPWMREGQVIHYGFDDPGEITGSDEEIMAGFRQVRDDINSAIPQILRDYHES